MYYILFAVSLVNLLLVGSVALYSFRLREKMERANYFSEVKKESLEKKIKALSDATKALKDMLEEDQKLRMEQEEKRSRQEEMFFAGVNNILNYDISIAGKAAMESDAEE